MTAQEKTQLEARIQLLESQKTGDLFSDLEIQDQILEIEQMLGKITVNKENSIFECEGCGA